MFNQLRLHLQALLILLLIVNLGACSSLASFATNYTNNTPNNSISENNTTVAKALANSETTNTSALAPTPSSIGTPAVAAYYLGKLNLQIIADEKNKKSFNLDFELQGNAKQGQFDLMGPLGAQLAQLQWSENSASLRQGKKEQSSENLNALLQPLLGFEFPLQALFSWLEKNNIQELQNLGWTAQELQLASGKRALRLEQKTPKVIKHSAESSTSNIANLSLDSSAFTTVKVLIILNQPENSMTQ